MLGFISPATLFYHSIPLRDPALIVQLFSLIAYSLRLLIETIHLHSFCLFAYQSINCLRSLTNVISTLLMFFMLSFVTVREALGNRGLSDF